MVEMEMVQDGTGWLEDATTQWDTRHLLLGDSACDSR